MTQHKKEDMQRINYKSDFDFILKLRDCKGDAVGFPGYDWEARLWTPQNKANAYTASCRGGVCENCYNDNGEIHIVCDGHRLGLGQLCAELTVELPNGIYPDGYRKRVEPQLLDIELVNDAGDCPTEAQTEVAVAYAVIDAYDMAVASGYEGTREEYTASLGMLPDLAATVSDLRQGKREIAEALTEQGIPTAADAPMAEMAEGVRSLYAIPSVDEGSRDHTVRGSSLMRYDIINELNRHRRADMPYSCGMTFTGDDAVFPQGADGWLLSDGTRLGAEGGAHRFADGDGGHYAICYFASDFYAVPWPAGVNLIDCAAVDSHPCISRATAPSMVSLVVDADPADYTARDISLPTSMSSAVIGGVEVLGTGSSIAADSQTLLALELPDLTHASRTIASNCTNLKRLYVRNLKTANGIAAGCPNLETVQLHSLTEFPTNAIGKGDKLQLLELPSLEATSATMFWNTSVARTISLPNLTTALRPILDTCTNVKVLKLDSLMETSGNGYFLKKCPQGVDIRLGKQDGAHLDLSPQLPSDVQSISVEKGFKGTLVFPAATALTAECLRTLLERLGDNTGGATHRIQMGADNLAKLTEDEIVVATAKNYTVL